MKKHVLLVDNEKSELNSFIEALNLTKMEYKCTWSQTGAQAISQLQYLQPDFIFIKAQLPDMDTLDLLSQITRLSLSSQTKIILFTDRSDTAYGSKAAALGATAVIESALDSPAFQRELQDLLSTDDALTDKPL